MTLHEGRLREKDGFAVILVRQSWEWSFRSEEYVFPAVADELDVVPTAYESDTSTIDPSVFDEPFNFGKYFKLIFGWLLRRRNFLFFVKQS